MISGLGQQFAGLQNLPLRKPAPGPAKPLVATLAQGVAAERLGCVFELTAARGGLPLNRNAIPTAASNAALPVAILAALGSVFGSDGFRPQTGKTNRYALYKADYDAVMPLLDTAVRTWTNGTLTTELEKLNTLLWNLQRTQTASDLHHRAFNVARTGGYGPSDLEIKTAYGNPRLRQQSDHLYYDPSLDKIIYRYGPPRPEANLQQLIRARLAPLVRREMDETLSSLFVHPRGIDILREYSVSPEAGTRCASWHVSAARDAVIGFRKELIDPDNSNAVSRYPGLVLGGVASLGLHDLPGFPEYAVAIGQVLAASRAEPLVGAAGVALFAIGLVLTGPAGLLVLAAADLAVAGATTALAFLTQLFDSDYVVPEALRDKLVDVLVIVPTSSLHIEALVGTHPLPEDPKLIHRALDVKKVEADARHQELENLRLARRLFAGKDDDPDIDKNIVVGNGAGIVVGTD
jgi:hypothetical protein